MVISYAINRNGVCMTDINYLEEERIKLWEEVTRLKDGLHDLSIRTPEDLRQARQNSKETSMFRNKTQKTSEEAAKIHLELSKLLNEMQAKATNLSSQIEDINIIYDSAKANGKGTNEIYEEVQSSLEDYNKNLEQIKAEIAECQTYLTKAKNIFEQIQQQSTDCSSYETKIIFSHKKTLELHRQIKSLYDEIFGYDEENVEEETKNSTHVEGLKDILDKTYEKLTSDLVIFVWNLTILKKKSLMKLAKIMRKE